MSQTVHIAVEPKSETPSEALYDQLLWLHMLEGFAPDGEFDGLMAPLLDGSMNADQHYAYLRAYGGTTA